jgi:hypothetical protein
VRVHARLCVVRRRVARRRLFGRFAGGLRAAQQYAVITVFDEN